MNGNVPSTSPRLSARLKPHGTVRHNDFVLKFWRDPYEMTLFPDGRAIIKGTTDTAVARSLYARYRGKLAADCPLLNARKSPSTAQCGSV